MEMRPASLVHPARSIPKRSRPATRSLNYNSEGLGRDQTSLNNGDELRPVCVSRSAWVRLLMVMVTGMEEEPAEPA